MRGALLNPANFAEFPHPFGFNQRPCHQGIDILNRRVSEWKPYSRYLFDRFALATKAVLERSSRRMPPLGIEPRTY